MKLAHILVCHSVDPTKVIESIPHRDGDLWFVFLHSDSALVERNVLKLMKMREGNVFDYKSNRGLGKSWNEGIHLAMQCGCEAVILLNDDLYFYEEGYSKFVSTIGAVRAISQNVAYVTTLGLETGSSAHAGQVLPQGFACCAIMPETISRIGYFDETFGAAYFEDIDYERRAILSGMTIHIHQEILTEHERSSTNRMMSESQKKLSTDIFIRNKEYFHRKWGKETNFVSPFNRLELSCYISFAHRNKFFEFEIH